MSSDRRASLDDLKKRIGETARSRFKASKRLEVRDQGTGWIVAFASTYTIVLTVLPYFVRLPTKVSDLLNLATVGLSIVTLVASLIVGSRRDAVNAEQFHRSALELNELKRELGLVQFEVDQGKELSRQDMERLGTSYNNILQKYSVNHDQIDFEALMLERPQDYGWLRWPGRLRIRLNLFVATRLPSFVMLVLTALVVWLVFGYALPSRL